MEVGRKMFSLRGDFDAPRMNPSQLLRPWILQGETPFMARYRTMNGWDVFGTKDK
jgi:hypothetical protein